MARRDEFDDEGFLDSLLKRKGNTALPPGLRRIFIVIGILVVTVVLISVAVSSWPSHHEETDDAAVPIIRADTTEYKVKPTDPGGMNVPNKDSTIFETLKGKQEADAKPENLLDDDADTKSAITPREAVAAKVEPTKTAPLVDLKLEKTGTPPDEALETALPQPVAKAETPVAAKPVSPAKPPEVKAETPVTPLKASSVIADLKKDNVTPAEKIAAAKAAKAPAKPAVKTDAKPVGSGGSTYIQLASVKTEADVAKQWSSVKAKNPELGSLSMKTQKADLGEKGIYYRLQAGPLTPENATKVCAALKARGSSCIIAK